LDLVTALAEPPTAATEHFFVDMESSDPILVDEISGLADDVKHAQSITRFLTLPIVTQRSNPRNRDPVVDFTKSVILTSDQYLAATTQLQ
jgi:hypothetical protein